jgi:hypothetical protein
MDTPLKNKNVMVKQMLMLASAAVLMAACQKEKETDFEKGKKDGKAYCSCSEKATSEIELSLCMVQHIDLNQLRDVYTALQLNDYAAGLLTSPCMLQDIMGRVGDGSDFADIPLE